jgi:hypothetical protein
MLIAIATLVVLLVMGRNDLSPTEIIGVVAFVILSGGVIAVFQLQPVIFIFAVVAADIYLILKVFGSDITIS